MLPVVVLQVEVAFNSYVAGPLLLQVNHCGTTAPVWLDLQGGTLPAKPGDHVDARSCAHWTGNCCNWQEEVTVLNCGAFFLYKLKPHSSCQLAFCAESKSK